MNYRNLLWLVVLTETTIAEGPYSCVVHPEAGKFITAMALGPEGHLFVGSEDKGLYRFDSEKWSVVPLPVRDEHPLSLAAQSETLWVGLSRSGVAAWEAFELWNEHNLWTGFAGGRAQAMRVTEDGGAWVGTPNGLWMWDQKWQCMATRLNGGNSQPFSVTAIEPWRGRLLVGTSLQGLWELTEKGCVPFGSKGPPDRRISALKVGPDSLLWVGSESGLAQLAEGEWHVIPLPIGPRTEEERKAAVTPESQAVTCIRSSPDGALWIGTRCEGLFGHDPGSGRWVHVSTSMGLPDAYVRAMEIGPDHRVWVGTYGGGVAELFTP